VREKSGRGDAGEKGWGTKKNEKGKYRCEERNRWKGRGTFKKLKTKKKGRTILGGALRERRGSTIKQKRETRANTKGKSPAGEQDATGGSGSVPEKKRGCVQEGVAKGNERGARGQHFKEAGGVWKKKRERQGRARKKSALKKKMGRTRVDECRDSGERSIACSAKKSKKKKGGRAKDRRKKTAWEAEKRSKDHTSTAGS